ncbi:MAG: peptidyl-prolyl cis-trans isomerase [Candidatus Sumerlaeia bacterium]|nr:peptidyl-prolyl cis-trans isomerase [Candidatus Sumerlaeia bacterium]
MRSWRKLLTTFTALATVAGCLALLPGISPGHGLEQEVENLDDNEVGVYVDGEPYTVGQLKILLTVREAPYRRSEYIFFGISDLANMGYQDPIYRILVEDARREGYTLTKEEREKINAKCRDMARNVLFRREILEGIPTPDRDALEEIYEEVKDQVLRMDERWIIREIFLPIGEEDFEEKAGKTIQEAWERLEDGETFVSLMEEYNPPGTRNTARIIIPDADTEMPEAVREAFLGLDNRTYSKPIRSTRGYHLVYRQMRIPSDYIPYESAREYLLEQYREQVRNQRIDDFFRPMVMDRNLVQPHLANLQSRGYLALDDDIAVRVGGRPIMRRELAAAAGWHFSAEVRHGETSFREAAVRMGPIQEALLDLMVEEESLIDSPDIVYYREAVETTLLVRKYLRSKYDPEKDELTREEIGGFFRGNRETFPTDPLIWGFRKSLLVPGMSSANLLEKDGSYTDVENFLEGLRVMDGIEATLQERVELEGVGFSEFTEEERDRLLAVGSSGGVSMELVNELADVLVIDRIEGLDYPQPADEVKVRELLKIEKFHWFVDRTVRDLAGQKGYTLEPVFPM